METKKLFLVALASVCMMSSAVAEIHTQKRYVEVGVDLSLAAMQNAFAITDIMVKDLVIDFTKLANDLPSYGLVANVGFDAKTYFNVDFNKWGFGVFAQTTGNFSLGMSKDIFTFLGEGIKIGDSSVTSVNMGLETYAEVGVPIKAKIGKITVRATPSLYVPLVYVPQPNATITVNNNADGSIEAVASADFALYSLVDLSSAFEGGTFSGVEGILNQLQSMDIPSTILNKGGIDLNATVEYALNQGLDLGVYTHIPIKPAHLDYKTSGNVTFTASVNPLLNSLLGGGSLSYSFDGPTFSGIQCSTVDYAVNRPFRLGAEVAWRPFSKNWFTLTGSAGIAATNPFGADFDWATSLYPEYSVSADVTLVYVFGFNATSSYINHMFTQSLGFKLNLRLLELDVSIASSSADFLKSWTLAGATAYAGVKFGF